MNRATTIVSLFLIYVLTAIPSVAQPPQTQWTQTFNSGINTNDRSFEVQQTEDGGFVVAGYGEPDESGYTAWVIKTDAEGNEIWSRFYGEVPGTGKLGIVQTSDGGFVVAGDTYTLGEGFIDIWLMKVDENGNELWLQTYGYPDSDRYQGFQQTSDGGLIIVGNTNHFGLTDILLIRTDESGNQLWSRTFGLFSHEAGTSVQQTSDGGFIVAGSTQSVGAGSYDGVLIKTDSEGEVEWQRTYGDQLRDSFNDVRQTRDGGYIMLGETSSYDIGSADLWLMKADADGNEHWWRNFGGYRSDRGRSIRQTADDGFIIAGSYDLDHRDPDFWLLKVDLHGDQVWSQLYRGEGQDQNNNDDEGYSVRQTADGGYIAAGEMEYDPNRRSIALIRLGNDVNPGMTLSITPQNPPIVFPPEGGAAQYTAIVQNPSAYPQMFTAWTEVDLPNGTTFGPVLFRPGLSLAPGGQITVMVTQEFPGFAPAGVYVYRGAIGYHPYSVFDSSEFEFEKLPPAGQTSVNNWNTTILK
jgi:hypothetical protein